MQTKTGGMTEIIPILALGETVVWPGLIILLWYFQPQFGLL